MPEFIDMRGNGADAVTGERCLPGERVFDTGFRNRSTPYLGNYRSRVLKEATIVWLAEQAGYDVVKRDAGDSGDAKGVDAGDAESGDGEVEVAEVKAGGSKPVKRRASGTAKGK
jgi:hypothetical protein